MSTWGGGGGFVTSHVVLMTDRSNRLLDDGEVHIYIDGAHAVHNDGRGQLGLYLAMGKGAIMNVSKKLRLVTTSSTEIEVVANGKRFTKCS